MMRHDNKTKRISDTVGWLEGHVSEVTHCQSCVSFLFCLQSYLHSKEPTMTGQPLLPPL